MKEILLRLLFGLTKNAGIKTFSFCVFVKRVCQFVYTSFGFVDRRRVV